MSVVAWDGRTLAADRRGVAAGLVFSTRKIVAAPDALLAFTGEADSGEAMVAWFLDGALPEKFPESNLDKERWSSLVAIKRDCILRYESTPHPIYIYEKKCAWGSGRDFAITAMYLGKCAADAVEIASLFEHNCGNGVDTLELP